MRTVLTAEAILSLPDVFTVMLDNGKKEAAYEMLCLYGKDLIRSLSGSDAIQFAMEVNAPEIIKLLIDYGVGGKYNKDYYSVIYENVHTFKTPIIENTSEDYINIIALAIMSDNREVAMKMIKEAVNINAWNDKDRSLLMWAALKDDVNMAETLLSLGADINRKNRNENTALDASIWRLQREVAASLTTRTGARFLKKELVEANASGAKVPMIKILKALTGFKSEEVAMIRFLIGAGGISHELAEYDNKKENKKKQLNIFEKIDEIVMLSQKVANAIKILKESF
ncbi:MAG: ankyrin repeat domain-containing protein [bacterium]